MLHMQDTFVRTVHNLIHLQRCIMCIRLQSAVCSRLPMILPIARREDVATGSAVPQASRRQLYCNLASAAESGWDFSSRWMAPGGDLASTRTTSILPVDLNVFLWRAEVAIARLSQMTGCSAEHEVRIEYCKLPDFTSAKRQ
jgi:Trehalase